MACRYLDGVIRLHDTARGEVAPVEVRDEGRVAMYVCGPTVYGPPHLGHGRFTLVFDVLRRYLEWCGYEVRYVSNVTDIDDNIIERALREGRDSAAIAAECEALWYEGMDAIGVKRPDDDPHATAYVDQMVELIDRLVADGYAYETGDGVYFAVERVDGYGLLARQSLDTLLAGARVEVDEDKRSAVDFVLWKKSKPGEPAWESPWGPGRPGWHTECVVMSLGLLGDGFDIHGGGQDLAFPHHENERAQALAIGRPFARHWVHNGFIEIGGEKMSKSTGNYADLLDLVGSTDPRSFRLLVLQSHYRTPLEVNADTTDQASAALARLDAFARRTAALPEAEPDAGILGRFRDAMDDDLDTPRSLDLLFTVVRDANRLLDEGDEDAAAPLASAAREILDAVGLEVAGDEASAPPEAVELLARRDAARADRDFDAADRLREELRDLGWEIEDAADGSTLRARRG